jgi:hypothetical protein
VRAVDRREASVEVSIMRVVDRFNSLSAAAAVDKEASSDSAGLVETLRALCMRMDSPAFLGLKLCVDE